MTKWSGRWSGRWSRRGVLALVAAGVGEVGALAASAAAGAHFASAAAATNTTTATTTTKGTTRPVEVSGPLAAFVPDERGDTIVIMRGEQETTITDPTLVRALLSFSSSF